MSNGSIFMGGAYSRPDHAVLNKNQFEIYKIRPEYLLCAIFRNS